jgi:hypothetical protein
MEGNPSFIKGKGVRAEPCPMGIGPFRVTPLYPPP